MMSSPHPPRPLAGVLLALAGACAPVAGEAAEGPALTIHLVEPGPGSKHRPVLSRREIEETAAPFLGLACDARKIEETIGRRYRFLGYVPTIAAVCDGQGGAVLTLRESSHRIDLITFDPAELSRLGLSLSPDYEEKVRLYAVPQGTIRTVLRGLLQTREGDLYNHARYQSDSEALRRLGYAIAFVPGQETDPESYPSGAYLIQALAAQEEGETHARRRTSYIGGTGSYGPRQGGAIGAQYEKDEIFAPLDRLTIAPRYNAGLGGQISYLTPRMVATRDPLRLYDLEVDLYSDFTHDRLLNGVSTDERRSGLGTTLGIRPLGLAAPHDLRLIVGARHERVHLTEEVPGSGDQSLTVVQLGATEDWRHVFRWPSLSIRLKPLVEFSIAAGGAHSSFVRPSLDANLHGLAQAGFEVDLHLVGGTIDRRVASFEEWSLGGAATVRGFREDAFLGRSMAALQSEIWLPFVPATGAEPRFQPRAARLLKWALFVDAGRVAGTTTGTDENLFGAGIGLRFVVPRQPLVVRIDYGWSLGARRGDAFPYLSIGYRY